MITKYLQYESENDKTDSYEVNYPKFHTFSESYILRGKGTAIIKSSKSNENEISIFPDRGSMIEEVFAFQQKSTNEKNLEGKIISSSKDKIIMEINKVQVTIYYQYDPELILNQEL